MSTIIAQKYWVPNEFGFAIMDWASIWSHNWSKSTLQNCSRLILPTIAIALAILFTFIFLGLLSFLIWHKLILDWTTHSLWKKRWFTGKCGWGFPIFSSCAISPAEWKKWIFWWKRWLAGTRGLGLGAWGAQSDIFLPSISPHYRRVIFRRLSTTGSLKTTFLYVISLFMKRPLFGIHSSVHNATPTQYSIKVNWDFWPACDNPLK